MESAMRFSTSGEASVTFADLCRALASGRLSSGRQESFYELRLADLRRWRRQELAARRLIASLEEGVLGRE
ncbi:MAG TPA: hypothetical protein VMV29_13745 [Ktedonobacterales bacterium]|nr:hypothetical protein [Ktedonobacterales bacterium]